MGRDPSSPEVRAIIARWHQHMRYFYEPTPEIMLGLAQGYAEDPRFRAFYERLHPELPDYLRAAIEAYVAHLTAGK